jgi:hypothetical protein
MPSCVSPAVSMYLPSSQLSSTTSVTSMIWPPGKPKSSSSFASKSYNALTLNSDAMLLVPLVVAVGLARMYPGQYGMRTVDGVNVRRGLLFPSVFPLLPEALCRSKGDRHSQCNAEQSSTRSSSIKYQGRMPVHMRRRQHMKRRRGRQGARGNHDIFGRDYPDAEDRPGRLINIWFTDRTSSSDIPSSSTI